MLLILLIGWIVLLPAIVVVGLYVSSSVLGRRGSAPGAYEDLFEDEQVLETEIPAVTPESITGRLTPPKAPAAPTVGARY
jgi:hypothetical protein